LGRGAEMGVRTKDSSEPRKPIPRTMSEKNKEESRTCCPRENAQYVLAFTVKEKESPTDSSCGRAEERLTSRSKREGQVYDARHVGKEEEEGPLRHQKPIRELVTKPNRESAKNRKERRSPSSAGKKRWGTAA